MSNFTDEENETYNQNQKNVKDFFLLSILIRYKKILYLSELMFFSILNFKSHIIIRRYTVLLIVLLNIYIYVHIYQ